VAESQNGRRACQHKWSQHWRKRPVKCIFLDFPFIETIRSWHGMEEICDVGHEPGWDGEVQGRRGVA
jgi:hypothetical protein